jgi:hypothetical protein
MHWRVQPVANPSGVEIRRPMPHQVSQRRHKNSQGIIRPAGATDTRATSMRKCVGPRFVVRARMGPRNGSAIAGAHRDRFHSSLSSFSESVPPTIRPGQNISARSVRAGARTTTPDRRPSAQSTPSRTYRFPIPDIALLVHSSPRSQCRRLLMRSAALSIDFVTIMHQEIIRIGPFPDRGAFPILVPAKDLGGWDDVHFEGLCPFIRRNRERPSRVLQQNAVRDDSPRAFWVRS